MRIWLLAVVWSLMLIALPSCDRADMYTMADYRPAAKAVYIFDAGPYKGNLGGRPGADALCRQAWMYKYPQLIDIGTARAFLSTGEFDPIINTVPSEYWDLPVMALGQGGSNGIVSPNWMGMWDGSTDLVIGGPLGFYAQWWSGSYENGMGYSNPNCEGWTTEMGLGVAGDTSNAGTGWINSMSLNCTTAFNLLCVGY